MLIAADLSALALAAGEPLLLEVQLQAADGAVPDASARAFILSFYRTERAPIAAIEGERTGNAGRHLFRFVRDGSFSELLFAATAGAPITVELAERLRNGRIVLTSGLLTIATSAGGVPSLDAAPIGKIMHRVTARDDADLGRPPRFSLSHARVDMPDGPGAPYFALRPSIVTDGSPQVGETYTGQSGTIPNATVESIRWLLDGAAIAGAVGTAYQGRAADVGKPLQFEVTAVNEAGRTTALSDAIIVAAAPQSQAPGIDTPAAIGSDGTPQVGEQLTGVDPIFRHAAITRRRWLRGTTVLATTQTYRPDATGSLVWSVDGLGDDGSPIKSESTIVVAAATAPPPTPPPPPPVPEYRFSGPATIAEGSAAPAYAFTGPATITEGNP